MRNLKYIFTGIFFLSFFLSAIQINAFCGFYVAKTDTNLFNDKSEVIIVRDGDKTTVTMSNDFQGDVKDFAMVVPVPEVLKEKNIKVVNRGIFDKLNAYSAPRLVEYYDANPCQPVYQYKNVSAVKVLSMTEDVAESITDNEIDIDYGVTIEAEYTVGEYDILILSAEESDGLKLWLDKNGYKIPKTANEVLDPYIKNGLKFFVVKVNLENFESGNSEFLSPIQITYTSDRFMLPIRLGMANSNGEQDMLVYAFSRKGRIECTNYRTVNVPSNKNIPLFVEKDFDNFYVDLFKKSYEREGRNTVFLEYAWDVSPNGGIKCDPCVSPPPIYGDFREAGVDWAVDMSWNSKVHFTRLHVRYTRDKFPQDLFFQETPNQERFQCRYVLTHPAEGDLTCAEGQSYLKDLEMRRKLEIDELAALTGWEGKYSKNYIKEYSNQLGREDREHFPVYSSPLPKTPTGGSGMKVFFAGLSILLLILGTQYVFRKRRVNI